MGKHRQAPLSIVVRHPHSSNIFSDTNGPVKARFHIELQWDGGMKVCSNDLGHVTKMATMPIYPSKWAKWYGISVGINICHQGVICPCPGAINMYKSIKIYTRTNYQVSVYRTTGPLVCCNLLIWLVTMATKRQNLRKNIEKLTPQKLFGE